MLLQLLLLCVTYYNAVGGNPINTRPVIGVLAQELSEYMHSRYPGNHSSYIASSYIKFVEGAGARVVPIMINQTQEYYAELVDSINGVLIPGGAASFDIANGFADAGWILYNLALSKNQQGDYFPIWGTCLGFELLSYLDTGRNNVLTLCSAQDVSMPLVFKQDFRSSRLFKDAPQDIIDILSTENVTANFHHFCLTERNMTESGLDRHWQVMSVNDDVEGLEFVSTMEHKQFPFYGVQFHPEKNAYEWRVTSDVSHTGSAVRMGQFFAEFLVNEARKSNHTFPSRDKELASLIYNYDPMYTGKLNSSFEQVYFF